ncbi:MAG: SdrD B-like domain-containing protein [Gemmataceae bacterium]
MFRQRKSLTALLQSAVRGTRPRTHRNSMLRLEALETREVPAVLLVTNTLDAGAGSLRQAILDSNASVGVADEIRFDIPETDTGLNPSRNAFVIQPATNLPTITDPVIIDGYTQAGSSANTLAAGNDAVIRVELDGSTSGGSGIVIGGGRSTVRGLAIHSFGGAGIQIGFPSKSDPGGSVVEGNFLGTDATGLARRGNSAANVYIVNGVGNRVGTDADGVNDPGERNVIIGSSQGIVITEGGLVPVDNVIAGNFIGTDRTGTVTDPDGIPFNSDDMGNSHGITLVAVTRTTIGGASPAARNIISGNYFNGILINGTGHRGATLSENNVVQGNFIGTDVTGTLARGNGYIGLNVASSEFTTVAGNVISGNGTIDGSAGLVLDFTYSTNVSGNFIGTDLGGTLHLGNTGNAIFMGGSGVKVQGGADHTIHDNVIAFNQNAGVVVTGNYAMAGADNIVVRGNSIHSNGGLGIDLAAFTVNSLGVTGNDTGDADTGPNGYQNFPLIAAASSSGSGTVVTGTLNSTAGTTFTLDFYASSAADPSGYGEGQVYLGSATVTTDGNGDAMFTSAVAGIAPPGWFVSATATGPGGTSEFSGVGVVVASNDSPNQLSISGGAVFEAGTFTLTGSFTDADASDTHTVTIRWGEGSPEVHTLPVGARSFRFDHVYADDNPTGTASDQYAVSVSLSDGTASTSADASVIVSNVAPSNLAWSVADTDLDEGDTAVVNGTFDDPGLQDVHTVTIDWGDGASQTYVLPVGDRSFSIRHRYADDNPTATPQDDYVVRVLIADDDAGAGEPATGLVYGIKSETAGAVPRTRPPVHLFTFRSDGTAFADLGTVRLNGTAIDADGLAFSPARGLLAYQMIHASSTVAPSDSQLVSLDTATAAATPIGSVLVGRSIRAAAFDAWDRLWVLDQLQDQLLQVDPATGAILGSPVSLTLGGSPYNLGDLTDLAIRDDGALVVADGAGASFYTLDPATGVLTFLTRDTVLQPGQSTTAPTGIGMAFHGDTLFTYDAQGTDDIYRYDAANGFTRSPVFLNIIPSYNSGQGDLATAAAGVKVTVHNLNPSIDLASATAAFGTGLVHLDGTYSDAGADTHTLTVNWGHGSPETVTVSGGVFHLTHQYPASSIEPGNQYSITATLTDDDTGVVSKTVPFTTSSIGGTVFHDTDGDGIRDSGEDPLAGWVVYVDANNNGVRDSGEAFTTTDSNGGYALDGLPAGTQSVRLERPAGWTSTNSPNVNVGSGDAITGANLGAYRNAIIRGTAYDDENANGRRDSGEFPLAGWTVFLDRDRNGVLDPGEARTVTNSAGEYVFDDLPAGEYDVRLVPADGWVDTSANPATVVVQTGASGQTFTANLGSTPRTASLSGFVWNDSNGNGDIDYNEEAIAGTVIELTGIDDRGRTVARTTTTSSSGHYEFDELRPGIYAVREVQPNGFADGLDEVGSLGGVLANDLITSIHVGAGDRGIGYNFSEHGGVALHRGQTATIGFWQNKNGQALLKSLNGGPNATALGNWLAASFPNLYGSSAGANNLTGKTNTQVAAYYITLFKVSGQKLAAQVLATAFAVYATDSDLAGTAARAYGFEVTTGGTGEARFNVGCSGASFGVADRTVLSIREILDATNRLSANGVIYVNSRLRTPANDVYDCINNTGDI